MSPFLVYSLFFYQIEQMCLVCQKGFCYTTLIYILVNGWFKILRWLLKSVWLPPSTLFMKRVTSYSSNIIYSHLFRCQLYIVQLYLFLFVIHNILWLSTSLTYSYNYFLVQNKSNTLSILLVCCLCISDLKFTSFTSLISFFLVNSSAFLTFSPLGTV